MTVNEALRAPSPPSLPHRERPAAAGLLALHRGRVGRPINCDTAVLTDAQKVFPGQWKGKKKAQEFGQRVAAGGSGSTLPLCCRKDGSAPVKRSRALKWSNEELMWQQEDRPVPDRERSKHYAAQAQSRWTICDTVMVTAFCQEACSLCDLSETSSPVPRPLLSKKVNNP